MNASFLLYRWAPWRQVAKITQQSQNGYRPALHSAYGSVDHTTNCTSVCVFTYEQGYVWVYTYASVYRGQRSTLMLLPMNCPFCFLRQSLLMGPEDKAGWSASSRDPPVCLSRAEIGSLCQCMQLFTCLLGLALKVSCLYHKNFTDWANSIANK